MASGEMHRYKLLRSIKSGSYGQVYLAFDKRAGKLVAIKKVRPSDPCVTLSDFAGCPLIHSGVGTAWQSSMSKVGAVCNDGNALLTDDCFRFGAEQPVSRHPPDSDRVFPRKESYFHAQSCSLGMDGNRASANHEAQRCGRLLEAVRI